MDTTRNPGRPRTTGQVVAVADGKAVAWDSGVFAGDPELAATAREAAQEHRPTQLHPHGPQVAADEDSAPGAAAAIMASKPGRVILTDFPEDVAALIGDDPDGPVDVPEPA